MSSITTEFEFDLERGERQLWSGRPEQGPVFRSTDLFLVPFSLVWAGGAYTAFFDSKETWNPVMLLFLVVGAYITIGRFFVDMWRRSRIIYGLTSERVIIVSGGTTKSINARTLTDVTLSAKSDGTGTISFGPTSWQLQMYQGMAWPGVMQIPAFEGIPEAKEVYQMIRQLQQGTLPAEERRLR